MASQLEESSFRDLVLVCFALIIDFMAQTLFQVTLLWFALKQLWSLLQYSININQSKKEHIKMLNVQVDFAFLKEANKFI